MIAHPALPQVQDLLSRGCQALADRDRPAAVQCALQAVRLDPESEQAWLLLAAIAPAQTRDRYLDHLLAIRPDSAAARKGLAELSSGKPVPAGLPGSPDLPTPEEILSLGGESPQSPPAGAGPASPSFHKPNGSGRHGIRWAALLIAVSCLLALTATAFVNVVSLAEEPPVFARIDSDPGTPAPSFTPSFTPTITASFTPSFTPTFTASPTYTASPTSTPVPYDVIVIPSGAGGERWIDVDISSQRVIAYEGSTPVGYFIVSTGVAAHPTVIGLFRIYVKLRYDNMSGPGYYLPNVPYVMYFYEGYSFHGTYWHHNFGTPMSHGCVNMRTEDAQWLYYWASVGTVVNVHW